MRSCKDCGYAEFDKEGKLIRLKCNPYRDNLEPECLTKHTILLFDRLLHAWIVTTKGVPGLIDVTRDTLKKQADDLGEADKWKGGDK